MTKSRRWSSRNLWKFLHWSGKTENLLYASDMSERRQRPGKKTKEAKDVKRRFTGKCYISAGGKILWWSRGTEVFWVENATELSKVKTIAGRKKWVIQRPASELGKRRKSVCYRKSDCTGDASGIGNGFSQQFLSGRTGGAFMNWGRRAVYGAKKFGRIKNRLCGN